MEALPNPTQLRRDRGICNRILVVTSFLLVGFSVVTYRLADLQIRQHESLKKLAAERCKGERSLPAQRGSIRDRSGEYLAFDERVWELCTDRSHLNDVELVRRHLSRISGFKVRELKSLPPADLLHRYRTHIAEALTKPIGLPKADLLTALASDRPVSVLQKDLSAEQAAKFRMLLSAHHIAGVSLVEKTERRISSKDRLTLLVGATDDKNQGIWGIERFCDPLLRGIPGKEWIEQDRKGRVLPLSPSSITPAHDGSDIFLTIDMNLQDEVEAIVDQAFKVHEPESAVAILIEPATGSILAMTCRPHLNPAENQRNWRNIPVSDAYEPGSVMKVFAVAGALDAGVINANSTIDCGYGSYTGPEIAGKTITDEKKNLGTQPISGILTYSSNIGTYKIARMLGWERFDKTLRSFGFGTPTGLAICQEPSGYWRPLEKMTQVDFSRLGFGYGITATALQQVLAYGAIANNGVLMKPRLIDRIRNAESGQFEVCPPEPLRQACTARTAAQIRVMLERVVTEGTGKKAQIEGIQVAGKTGTRRVFDPVEKIYKNDQHVVSFIGYAPAKNPRIACIIMLDNPKKHDEEAIGGGATAAPIFAQLVRAGLDHLNIRLGGQNVIAQSPAPSPPRRP